MEKELNISEILKDKSKGTRLYSPIFGECVFCHVCEDTDDICVRHYGEKAYFNPEGLYNTLGEVMLFPSKSMQDWSKFAWKKGDLLVNSCGFQCIFKEWASDDYTKFNGCYSNSRDGYEDVSNAETAKFDKLDHNIAYGYVREIERELGGKLNLETLEIEKSQPEFKDGDILLYKSAKFTYFSSIFILCTNRNKMCSYVRFSIGKESIDYDVPVCSLNTDRFRYATEEEKQQLFDALAKEGKAWDAEKKQIVDLKPKCELKPFDKVLVRDSKSDKWRANLFDYIDRDGHYYCVYANWNYCIPYIGNEHLLGTTKDVEG